MQTSFVKQNNVVVNTNKGGYFDARVIRKKRKLDEMKSLTIEERLAFLEESLYDLFEVVYKER